MSPLERYCCYVLYQHLFNLLQFPSFVKTVEDPIPQKVVEIRWIVMYPLTFSTKEEEFLLYLAIF